MSRTYALLLALGTALANLFSPSHDVATKGAKALVYCPVSVDESGCAAVVNALSAAFPGGVDRGWDGSGGTVDLTKTDLMQYSVLVVPSLADRGDAKPYALLRSDAVASRLRQVFIGRVAFWSGTPDLGQANRVGKDALIRNLATWASSNRAVLFRRGLVVLQDLSEDVTHRYDWVGGIAKVAVSADPAVHIYSALNATTDAGKAILDNGGSPLAYANMASFGLQVAGGSAAAVDAAGADGAGAALVTVVPTLAPTAPAAGARLSIASANGGPTVTTDRSDYAPGEIVTITGTGWGANEAVHLNLDESPNQDGPHAWDVTADANGGFVDQSFWPDSNDVGVAFTLTATGASGSTASTTFTDGVTTVSATQFFTVASGNCTATAASNPAVGTAVCAAFNVNTNAGNTSGNQIVVRWLNPSNAIVFRDSLHDLPASQTNLAEHSIQTPNAAGTWTIKLCAPNSNCQGGTQISSTTLTVVSAAAATSMNPVSGSGTFGGTATLTATLTSGGTGVSGKIVAFTLNTTSVGTATTNASGVATLTNVSLAGINAGNYATAVGASFAGDANFLTSSATGQLSVAQASQTITFGALSNKTYGDADFQVSATASSGLAVSFAAGATDKCTVSGTTVHLTGAGSCTVTASQAGNGNYSAATSVPQSFTIGQKALTASVAANNKVYDGTAAATLSGTPSLTGVVGADDVTLTGTAVATFANKTVGNGKIVTVTGLSLGGTTAPNYTLTTPITTTANITSRTLTVTATGVNKQYDGTTSATVTLGDDRVAGDVFTDAYTSASFADANVGTGKPVSVSGISISGADAGNYTANTTASATANITARAIAVAADAKSKVYGGAEPALTYQITSGTLVAGDNFTGSLTRAAGETVAGSPYAISQGTLALGSNYTLAFTGASLTITPLGLTTPTVTADKKVYDGTTSATIHFAALSGIVGSDNVTVTGAGAFSDKHVGTGKTVTVTGITLGGADAGNYTISPTTTTATADITARPLDVVADAKSKVYGDADPALTYHLANSTSLAVGDAFSGSLTRAAGEDVGGSPYAIGQGTLTATSDYNLSFTGAGLTITQRPVTVTVDAGQTKVYGSADPTPFTYHISSGSLAFSDAFSGALTRASGETVAGSPYAIQQGSLTLGANYNLSFVGSGFTITKKPLSTPTVTADNKVYDGNTSATIHFAALGGLVGNDAVTIGGTGAFTDKNVGTGKTVNVTGIALGGAAAGNYSVSPTTTTAIADITARGLTVTATGVNKVYDGTANATVTLSDNRVSGDALTDSYASASFADKTVGTGKTVSVSGISISGTDAGNYTLGNTTATTSADITAAALVPAITAADKYYDGSTAATITSRSVTGVIGNDQVTLTGGSAAFSDALVGSNKTVTGSGFTLSGADAGNYALVPPTATTTASIKAWTATGFYQPVDMPSTAGVVYNTTKAGSTVPLKFNLYAGTLEKTNTSDVQQPLAYAGVSCTTGSQDQVEVTSTGGTSLRYDATAKQFVYNWQTPSNGAGKCFTVTVKGADGTGMTAYFMLK